MLDLTGAGCSASPSKSDMNYSARIASVLIAAFMLSHFAAHARRPDGESSSGSSSETFAPPMTTAEARSRAKLLYETIHGTLQVVHRDFFDDEVSHKIPSASLEDVFSELAKDYDLKLKWLVVDTDVVNVDHLPEDDFERSAVAALKSGESQFEAVEADRYRFAGPIRLASQCLKCHVKNRSSTSDRTAGLLISMPLAPRLGIHDP